MSSFIDSKYLNILGILKKEELLSFEKWLKSPWCNSNKNLAILFSKLKKYHPDFSSMRLSDEQLFRRAFPGKKYSYHAMRNLLSESYRQAEQFLTHQHLRKKERFQKKFLAEEFQMRHREDPFFKILEKEINRLEEKEIRDWEDHFDLLDLNRQAYNHPNPNPRVPSDRSILKMDQHLDLVYLLEKAAIINEKIFRNRILKNENHDVEKDLKVWNAAAEGVQHTSIEFYKRRFAYSEENMLEEFNKLQNDFFNRFDELNKKDQETHLVSLMNDTAYLRKKRLIQLPEMLPLYNLGLRSKILIRDGKMTRITFVSIIVVSNACNSFSFSKEVIEDYLKYLPKEIQSDAAIWAKAHTLNKKGFLEQCLEIIAPFEFKESYFQRVGKLLILQTYFDLFLRSSSYQSYLLSFCDSYEKWVRRLPAHSRSFKEPLLRLIQKCRVLIKIYSDVDFRPEKLDNLFLNEKNIHAMNWLNKKVEEIKILKAKKT